MFHRSSILPEIVILSTTSRFFKLNSQIFVLQPQEVDANNIQNHIDNYNATVRAEAELEQLEARVLQAAPRDLRGGEGGDADADLNELLDRLNNEGQAQLNGLLGLALPPRPRANPNALEQPLQHVRPFR